MLDAVARLNPFQTSDGRRLATLFAIVYLAQGMWYLPDQTIRGVLKDRGQSAGQIDTFFLIATFAWNVKPLYGLLADFVPLFGRRRKSYVLLTTGLATVAGGVLALGGASSYTWLAVLVALMGFGLAFTDVAVDGLMVESGRAHGLTGAFQSVQWAAINLASVLTGVAGGYFASRRDLPGAYTLATCFPLASLVAAAVMIREPRMPRDPAAFRATWDAIRSAMSDRDLWLIAGFVFFFAFSPSLGTALYFHQTNTLGFDDHLVGILSALAAAGSVIGALVYAPLSRKVSIHARVVVSIGVGVVGTLGYLFYSSAAAALVIDPAGGALGMIALLAILDLAAKACPPRVEATFFALLMSVYNVGLSGSAVAGGYLYDWFGYVPLVVASAAFTALAWPLMPLVGIRRIEAKA